MQDIDKEIISAILQIFTASKAESAFMYGSFARGDFEAGSDVEVGLIFRREHKVSRSELARLNTSTHISIYPYILEDILNYQPDVPFPKKIFMYELISTARTLLGKDIIGQLALPKIENSDLLETITFEKGFAISAVIAYRNGEMKTARKLFLSSCLFASRILLLIKTQKFIFHYQEIIENTLKLDLDEEYKEILRHVLELRKKDITIDSSLLFRNLKYLDMVYAAV